jgi:tetratricopeptide (TPR) repeat protein
MAQQFPNGVQSLNPGSADTGKPTPNGGNAQEIKPVRSRMSVGISGGGGSNARDVSAEDNTWMELGRRAEQIAKDSENAPLQAIAQALSLPTTPERSPRAQALAGIVQSNVKKNPTAAKQALDELRKTAKDLIPENQVRYLVNAAKAYLELGETDEAQKTLDDGFKLSEKMLVTDKDAEDPNKALKAYWPSVDSYRQFLEIETKISRTDAQKMLDDIQDPEMQTIARVMFTNALLGKPMRTSVVSQKKKSRNFMSISNSD